MAALDAQGIRQIRAAAIAQAEALGYVIRLIGRADVAARLGIEPARDIVAASQGRVRLAPDARPMPLSLLAKGPMELAL